MLKQFLHNRINAFERQWKYDASYIHELIDIDRRAAMAFAKVQGLSGYRKDVPPAVYSAAGLTAILREDCGPCTQLTIDMAQKNGVEPAVLRAIVARDFATMPPEVAVAVRFADAVLAHSPDADSYRDEIVRRFGKRGLVSLSFAVVAAHLYPTLKYAMGHGKACMKLTIGGETRPVARALVPVKDASAA